MLAGRLSHALPRDCDNAEVRIFHKVYEEELGTIKGHFGPVNTIAYSPDGKSYVSGGEEGFIRVNTLDDEYFQLGLDEDEQP